MNVQMDTSENIVMKFVLRKRLGKIARAFALVKLMELAIMFPVNVYAFLVGRENFVKCRVLLEITERIVWKIVLVLTELCVIRLMENAIVGLVGKGNLVRRVSIIKYSTYILLFLILFFTYLKS